MPEIWPEPEKFDPMRFTDEAQRNRHRFAWVPFARRAYVPRLHFAYMQAKCSRGHFLQNLSVSLQPGLHAGLADVADPEARGRIARDAEAGWVTRIEAKAGARIPTRRSHRRVFGIGQSANPACSPAAAETEQILQEMRAKHFACM